MRKENLKDSPQQSIDTRQNSQEEYESKAHQQNSWTPILECGETTPGIHGEQYLVTLIDEFRQYIWEYIRATEKDLI